MSDAWIMQLVLLTTLRFQELRRIGYNVIVRDHDSEIVCIQPVAVDGGTV